MLKKISLIFIDISGLLGIVFQFTQISEVFKIIITVVFSVALCCYIYNLVNENKTYNREKRIKEARKFIMNSTNQIVFFGGNLSWVEDYSDCIKTKIADNCSVKVYFDDNPNLSSEAKENLKKNISQLIKCGCTVYKLNECYSLRCIISDVKNNSYSSQGIIIDKTHNDQDKTRNKYKIKQFNFNNEKTVSALFYDIVKMSENNSIEITDLEVQNI